ncbi:transglutaminase-like cysteine peptidase [Pelagibius sp. CAU 1746]|uniref:transglutaminase-like cysteine peptidase n=1 Tax=Pelagibius sp. CAU 1746 TaxID=3140370 RepID=UPI00325C110B
MIQAAKQAEAENTLFGTVEIRSDSLKGLQQWQRVVGAMRTAGPAFNNCAKSAGACTTSMLKRWREIVLAAKALPRGDRLRSVNSSFNRWPYKLDMEVYGVREYWATPKEFIIRSGDCEDYSIAKYYALRNVGFSKDELRIVALRDTIRGFGHAVMAAYVGGDILILDNTSQLVLPHSKYGHYVPQVSMNETSRWAHVPGKQRQLKAPSGFALSASTLFQKRQ